MITRVFFSIAAFSSLVTCLTGETTAVTAPVGYYKLTALGASDSYLSLPLAKRSAAMARVQAISADSVVLDLQNIADGAFAPGAGGSYYLQFVSGKLNGIYYKIIENNNGIFRLDVTGDDLTAHALGQVTTGENGDIVRICPYRTIADVFGGSEASLSLAPRPNNASLAYVTGDEILFGDKTLVGVEQNLNGIGYVVGSGWRRRGSDVDCGLQAIKPGEAFVVRRHSEASLEFVIVGDVPTHAYITRMPALADGQAIDLYVGLAHPELRSLRDSQLFSIDTSSVIASSGSFLNGGDFVLDFSDGRRGYALPPASRFCVVGSDWYKGDSPANDYLLRPGIGYVLRIRGIHSVRYWVQSPASF